MQVPKFLASAVLVGVVVAACGGGPGATQGPGGATQEPGGVGATPGPQATQSGGGNGGASPAGWDQYGKVHIEMSGPVQKSGDYGFVPAASIFGGAQGSSLSFTIDGSDELVSILISADNTVIVSYAGSDFSAPAAQCTTSNWNVGATSGSGSFDCTAGFVIMASGATVSGATIKGNFDAHG
jgi:hypothetical protein